MLRSVATNTLPPNTSGSPYRSPSSTGDVQARARVSTAAGPAATPVPATSWW